MLQLLPRSLHGSLSPSPRSPVDHPWAPAQGRTHLLPCPHPHHSCFPPVDFRQKVNVNPSSWARTCPSPSIPQLKCCLLSAWKYQPMLVSSIFPFSVFLRSPSFPQTLPWKPCHLQGGLIPPCSGSGVPAGEPRDPTCTLPPAHGRQPSPTTPWGAPGGWDMGHPKGLSCSPAQETCSRSQIPGEETCRLLWEKR